jgi:hypothetical protein
MRKQFYLAAGLGLAVLAGLPQGQARAQVAPYYFTLSDLRTIFVANQQYFDLNNEGFEDPSVNHLHFTTIDTTTGAFTGSIWAPTVDPGLSPQLVPVTGTITIHPGTTNLGISTGGGNHYEIEFSYEVSNICTFHDATYHGAFAFLGYQGSALMHGNIAGTIQSVLSGCGIGAIPSTPQPFSGLLVK